MGLLLDLAVTVLAVVVTASLGALAWTLGVSGVASVRQGRSEVGASRARLATQERRLLEASARARETLEGLNERTRPRYR